MKLLAFEKHSFVFLAPFALRAASSSAAGIAYIFVALYALRSRRHAVEALFLSFVFTNLNPQFFPSPAFGDIGRYLVVLAAFVSTLGRDLLTGQILLNRVSVAALFFAAYGMIHTLLFSIFPIISGLKMLIWAMAFVTLVQAWGRLSAAEQERLEERIYTVLSVMIVASLLLSFNTQAYIPRTSLLRGVMNHSQALGSTAVLVAIWSLVRALGVSRPSWLDFLIFTCSFTVILGSGTRTALLTLALSILMTGILASLNMGRLNLRAFPGLRSKRFFLLIVVGFIALLFQLDTIRDVLIKNTSALTGGSTDLAELYKLSRGGLIAEMWSNISVNPFVGIGFGLASDPLNMTITYAAGIPISAIVEKGVTLLAIWEELGVLGLILFLFMLLVIFMHSIKLSPLRTAMLVAIVLINFGEASLMSAGGIGLIQLILLGWIISCSTSLNHGRRTQPGVHQQDATMMKRTP